MVRPVVLGQKCHHTNFELVAEHLVLCCRRSVGLVMLLSLLLWFCIDIEEGQMLHPLSLNNTTAEFTFTSTPDTELSVDEGSSVGSMRGRELGAVEPIQLSTTTTSVEIC